MGSIKVFQCAAVIYYFAYFIRRVFDVACYLMCGIYLFLYDLIFAIVDRRAWLVGQLQNRLALFIKKLRHFTAN